MFNALTFDVTAGSWARYSDVSPWADKKEEGGEEEGSEGVHIGLVRLCVSGGL